MDNFVGYLFLWLGSAGIGAFLGTRKGYGNMGCILGALFGPFGWLVVWAMGEARQICPHCKSVLTRGASVCARCGRETQVPVSVNDAT